MVVLERGEVREGQNLHFLNPVYALQLIRSHIDREKGWLSICGQPPFSVDEALILF